jgi:outer membrane receptor protein involved in Fe transport
VSIVLAAGFVSRTWADAAAAGDYEKMSLEELLDTRIEVGSLETETIFDTPSAVSVIDREMIQRHNFLSISEALRVLAGFDVSRTHFKRDIVTSRGILQEHYSNKVLVMINSVAAWHAVTGESSLERVDINDVERIEVLKGPASVLYGTNAYVGAVNIVLRVPESNSELQAHGALGDKHAFGGGGRYGFAGQGWKVFVAASARDEAGHDLLFTDEQAESGHMLEYMRGSQFTASIEKQGHTLLLNGFAAHESFLGTTVDWDQGIGRDHVSRGYLASYTFNRTFNKKFGLRAGGSFDGQERNFSRSRDDLRRSNARGYRASAFATTHFNVSPAVRLELGGDFDYRRSIEYTTYDVLPDTVFSDNGLADLHMSEASSFAQLRTSYRRFKLLLGTRLTHNDLFGTNLSSRGTLVYTLNERNSLKFILGQSYRVPSFFELYLLPSGPTVYGNNRLEPETSDSIELAYVTSFKQLFAQALVYHARYDKKIFRNRRFPDNPADRSLVYLNGDPVSANGLEVELRYRTPRAFDAFLNYNYIDGDRGDAVADEPDHYNFKYVPRNSLSLGLARSFGPVAASAVLNGQQSVDGPKARVDAWQSLDLNLSYAHDLGSLSLRHTFSAKNVTDDAQPIPEFVRRVINEIPSGSGRRFIYTVVVRPGGSD